MVAAGLEDGIEVERLDAQTADVVQLLLHALQIAAKEIVGGAVAPFIIDHQGGIIVPLGVIIAAEGQVVHIPAAGIVEAIHKDLHHHAFTHPLRSMISGIIHGNLEGGGLGFFHAALASQTVPSVAQIPGLALFIRTDEIVPKQTCLLRHVHLIFIQVVFHPAHVPAVLGVIPPDAQGHIGQVFGKYPQTHLTGAGKCAGGVAILFRTGIVNKNHNYRFSGFKCQILSLYSLMVRSAANTPEQAVFSTAFLSQRSLSV